LATVAVLHLAGLCAGGEGEQLVTETDAKDGLVLLQGLLEVGNGGLALGWVAGAVAHKETVILVIVKVIVPRHNRELDAALGKAADLVVFLKKIKKNSMSLICACVHRL